jgi:hypothetical protein
MASNDDAPDELPSDVLRVMSEQEQEATLPPPPPPLVYREEATAWALKRWEDAGVNASADRPWRGDYLRVIGEVAPWLARYTTLEELVAGFYEGTFYPLAVRVAQLKDGRQLDAWTIWAAAFWQHWREIEEG